MANKGLETKIWRGISIDEARDLMDFQGKECYISREDKLMTARPETVTQNSTAAYIRGLAAQHHVAYIETHSDRLAQHMTQLADDAIQPDEIECMLLALQRAGHLSRRQLIHLQVEYLREAKP